MFYTKIRKPSKGKSFPPPVPAANFIVWREMVTWNAFIDLNAQKWLPLRHLLWYMRFEFHSCTFNILQLIFGHLRLGIKENYFFADKWNDKDVRTVWLSSPPGTPAGFKEEPLICKYWTQITASVTHSDSLCVILHRTG